MRFNPHNAELARLQHGHLSLEQVRPYLRPEEFGSFFKFAFVRNPFDRFVLHDPDSRTGRDRDLERTWPAHDG